MSITPENQRLMEAIDARKVATDARRREVQGMSRQTLRARYIQRTGDRRPPRNWKIGDYIEFEVLAALNDQMATENQ